MYWNKILLLKNQILTENEDMEENEVLESEDTLCDYIYSIFINNLKNPITDKEKEENEKWKSHLSSDILNDIDNNGELNWRSKLTILDAYRLDTDPTYIYIKCKFKDELDIVFPIDAGYNFIA